ncbi:MAG: polysaccharide biosynthesis/export family protein [Idiomarina sp.]|nr:polysaccharide biosynthesis/export family protein [Idiomarina sp.]
MTLITAYKLKMLALSSVVFLSACAYAPGSHVNLDEAGRTLEGEVQVFQISPQLISDLRRPVPQAAQNAELEQARGEYDYRVGRGDILNITVWNHPELTIPAGSQRSAAEAGNWVHNDGTIFYPYIGRVNVEGMRVTEIRNLVAERLSDFIESPQVEVTIAAFHSQRVYVTGEVRNPGTVSLTNVPMTVLDAVNQVGGITDDADWGNVVLTRDGTEHSFSLRDLYVHGDTRQNTLVEPGDVIHIDRNENNRVFVLGEVRQAQAVTLNRSRMSLADALADVGGINEERADARGIFVFREAPEGADHIVDVYQLDIKEATAYVLADQFEMHPRDIVYVTAAPIARWNRLISNLMPTISGLYQVGRTDREFQR